MPLIPGPNRPARTSAGGGGIGNRCLARYWGQPCVPSPSPPYSSMSLRRMSSDTASGFPSLLITVILRMPVMASGHLLQRRLHLLLLRLDPSVAVVLGGGPLLFLPPPGIHACRPQVPLDAREYVQAPRRLGVLAPQGLGVQRRPASRTSPSGRAPARVLPRTARTPTLSGCS